jgi:hypothetical protein
MRIFAIHDPAGNISEIVTCPDDVPAPIVTRAGFMMTEIEAPVGVADSDLESPEQVEELVNSYRVDVARQKSSLVSRE